MWHLAEKLISRCHGDRLTHAAGGSPAVAARFTQNQNLRHPHVVPGAGGLSAGPGFHTPADPTD